MLAVTVLLFCHLPSAIISIIRKPPYFSDFPNRKPKTLHVDRSSWGYLHAPHVVVGFLLLVSLSREHLECIFFNLHSRAKSPSLPFQFSHHTLIFLLPRSESVCIQVCNNVYFQVPYLVQIFLEPNFHGKAEIQHFVKKFSQMVMPSCQSLRQRKERGWATSAGHRLAQGWLHTTIAGSSALLSDASDRPKIRKIY